MATLIRDYTQTRINEVLIDLGADSLHDRRQYYNDYLVPIYIYIYIDKTESLTPTKHRIAQDVLYRVLEGWKYDIVIPLGSVLMDTYVLARMFRYDTDEVIIYMGEAHASAYTRFFKDWLQVQPDQMGIPIEQEGVSRCLYLEDEI